MYLIKHLLKHAKKEIHEKFGPIDILINGAGGNSPAATTKVEKMDGTDNENPEDTFFGLQIEGFDKVFDLNFKGTLLPSMVFATDMVKKKSGVIINISSMNSYGLLQKLLHILQPKLLLIISHNGWQFIFQKQE